MSAALHTMRYSLVQAVGLQGLVEQVRRIKIPLLLEGVAGGRGSDASVMAKPSLEINLHTTLSSTPSNVIFQYPQFFHTTE